MTKITTAVLLAMILSGCAGPQTYSTEQVASKQYLYKTVELQATLDNIESAHIRAMKECGLDGSMIIRKPRSNNAAIVTRLTGFMVPNTTLAVMEFEENGGKVFIDAYTPYPGWREHLDILLAQIQGEHRCFQ